MTSIRETTTEGGAAVAPRTSGTPISTTPGSPRAGRAPKRRSASDPGDGLLSSHMRALVVDPLLPSSFQDGHEGRESHERQERMGPRRGERDAAARLEEAVGLAEAIGLQVVAAREIPLRRVRAATYLGRGAVEILAEEVAEGQVAVAIVNTTLTPGQQRNLEKAWDCKVLDRTGLILEIFGARARTREGRLQVELAALTYQRSRLVRSWTHLERQRGGGGFMGGPGETQIEADRRQIDSRLARLRRELKEVARTRGLHREARARVPYPVAALVGYTNAGKSTLFNRLTDADVCAEDLLFATLDPTMRGLVLPGGEKIILSDTVGFISDLPTDLVAAFRATLEEVRAADLIIHVRDISHPDSEAQRRDVHRVLGELGLGNLVETGQVIEVWNKSDRLSPEGRRTCEAQAALAAAEGGPVALVSARDGEGVDGLLALIEGRLAAGRHSLTLEIPLADGAALAWVYRHGSVHDRRDEGEHGYLAVSLDPREVARFKRRFPLYRVLSPSSPASPAVSSPAPPVASSPASLPRGQTSSLCPSPKKAENQPPANDEGGFAPGHFFSGSPS